MSALWIARRLLLICIVAYAMAMAVATMGGLTFFTFLIFYVSIPGMIVTAAACVILQVVELAWMRKVSRDG